MIEIGMIVVGMLLAVLIAAASFILGVGLNEVANRQEYVKELQGVAKLAELLIRATESENDRVEELRKAVQSLQEAVLALKGRKLLH